MNLSEVNKKLVLLVGCASLAFLVAGCLGGNRRAATGKSAASGPFQGSYVRGLGNPHVVVENQSELTISLELSGPVNETLLVPPKSRSSVTVKPGPYHYHASCTSAQKSGEVHFSANHRYRWTFQVVTIRY